MKYSVSKKARLVSEACTILFESQGLEVKPYPKLYLARSKDDRVVDRGRLAIRGVVRQHSGVEVDG